ncbi:MULTISPECIES: isoprenyl transferase [Kosmotoga]|uniref:Isoprenyl transferase n=1 Tax=Kosmotoga olearia (strain ATCC BAA-1733 / DSM 21960 / TBF 19.5.1) TaxID=521045 RepID=C5CF33_KOSOT|nr:MULTISPECIES: isoprenyl transferase [Kosmotoga]ACR80298.1 undecaprenyl diphosphate synthase [Kosmotoga olearia TBF 19.5.1]MDI3523545.1 undecaprenyl diphosphate synthase [Kosmotoga sp.]MDK2953055.1 undecaprenyl diphosphate synthase [Kosmotoga sp.]OAA20232.1 UDP diphosphate synthase [Kosmotoga sp. DU53]
MKIPTHIAIIMDGNGRWAKQRGLRRTEGHKKGAEVADSVARWAAELGIRYLTLYAFSTENWKRPKEEVEFLFNLLVRYINNRLNEIINEGIKLKFLGRIQQLPGNIRRFCENIEQKTAKNDRLNLIIALNYGGRAEIIDAVNKILAAKLKKVDEHIFERYLYLPEMPEPDLIIRTSGEKRLSNFLMWESAYSELYFCEKLWPEFTKDDFLQAIEDYSRRKRKFGAVIKDEE